MRGRRFSDAVAAAGRLVSDTVSDAVAAARDGGGGGILSGGRSSGRGGRSRSLGARVTIDPTAVAFAWRGAGVDWTDHLPDFLPGAFCIFLPFLASPACRTVTNHKGTLEDAPFFAPFSSPRANYSIPLYTTP